MAMTDLFIHQKQEEDRKRWNREIVQYANNPLCPSCGGPMEEMMFAAEEIGVEYDYICKNPDCPSKN